MSRRSTTTATGEAERRLVQQVRKALAQDARQLDLSQQNLSKFPGELVALLDEREMPLQRLNLSNNTLQRLPEQLDRLVGLHELLLSFNQIRSFPHCPQLCNLATVYLDHNQLESLPEGIASLRGLRKLVLDNNQLSELCNGFECLRQLESLSLNTNKFEKLPQVIFQLSKLKRLLIDNNQLIELSTDIQNLRNLEYLSINNNRLESLPSELGQINTLSRLFVCANPTLKWVPVELLNLSQMEQFRVDGPLFIAPPIIEAGGLAIMQYLLLIRKYDIPLDRRRHWQSDQSVNECNRCRRHFLLFRRRHHCRLCGKVYCSDCCGIFMQNAMLESVFSARICRICNEDIIRKADNATEIVTANALKLNEFNELPTERSISQSSAQVPSSTPTLSSMQSFSADSDVDLIAQQWKEVCRALFKHQKIRKALEQAEDLFAPYSDAQMALKAERNNIDRQIQDLQQMHEALQLRYSGRACFDDDEQQKMEDEAASNVNATSLVKAVVICDFEASNAVELSVKAGQLVDLLNHSDADWWHAQTKDGQQGFIPASSVHIL